MSNERLRHLRVSHVNLVINLCNSLFALFENSMPPLLRAEFADRVQIARMYPRLTVADEKLIDVWAHLDDNADEVQRATAHENFAVDTLTLNDSHMQVRQTLRILYDMGLDMCAGFEELENDIKVPALVDMYLLHTRSKVLPLLESVNEQYTPGAVRVVDYYEEQAAILFNQDVIT